MAHWKLAHAEKNVSSAASWWIVLQVPDDKRMFIFSQEIYSIITTYTTSYIHSNQLNMPRYTTSYMQIRSTNQLNMPGYTASYIHAHAGKGLGTNQLNMSQQVHTRTCKGTNQLAKLHARTCQKRPKN
jgi:hypothetical protein